MLDILKKSWVILQKGYYIGAELPHKPLYVNYWNNSGG